MGVQRGADEHLRMSSVAQGHEWQQRPVPLHGRVAALVHAEPFLNLGAPGMVEVDDADQGTKGRVATGGSGAAASRAIAFGCGCVGHGLGAVGASPRRPGAAVWAARVARSSDARALLRTIGASKLGESDEICRGGGGGSSSSPGAGAKML